MLDREIKSPYFYNSLLTYPRPLRVFDQYDQQGLKIYSMAIGPIPSDITTLNFEIAHLNKKGTVVDGLSYDLWKD